jgi:potassium-dependent mechanosensitive channel
MCDRYTQLKPSENLWKIFWLVDGIQSRKDLARFKLQFNSCPSRIAPLAVEEPTKHLCTAWRLVPAWAKDRRLCGCLLAAAIVVLAGPAQGQPKSESPPAPAEKTAPSPIPLAELATESESVSAIIRDIRADLSLDRSAETVAQQLPAVTREIDGRVREGRKIIVQRPSIEMLRSLEGEWRRLRRELSSLSKELTNRTNQLQRYIAQLDDFGKTWDQTFAAAKDSAVPQEVLGRIETVITDIRQAREAVEKERARVLTMLTRIGAQDARIADALRSVNEARENAFNRLFLQDSAPIWSPAVRSGTAQNLQEESLSSFSTQWAALGAYAERQALRFVLGIVVFIVLAAALFWTRRRVRGLSAEKPDLSLATPVFEMPIAAALILSLLGSRWIYPQAPRLLWATLGALALIPSVIILRRLITSNLYPIMYALIAFFFIDQLRAVAAAVQVLPRLLFLAEMFGAMVFLIWLVRSTERPALSTSDKTRSRKMVKVAGYVALSISSAAFIANILGYVTLANLLGNGLLESSYLALILYAIVVVLDGLAMIALIVRPLAALGTVSRHRSLLHHRIRAVLELLGVLLWILGALQQLLLRDPLFNAARQFLTAEFSVGSIHISLGDMLAFGITVWAAFLVSRFLRFLLDEDVYPRVNLKRGLAYAISNTLHYLILVVGFFLAVAALGFDMTRVTILAGAFSVGVGFGLQNIFNNFISGLILLFERPINIGDVVQIEDASGVVERIGIRASIIRTTNGSEVIMPNGKLISERLINWTLSSRQHGIELPIAVAQGTDPKRVIALLEKTAAAHPLITGDPPPQAMVVKLGADSLSLELRAWTDHAEQWMQIRSELAIAISSALAAEEIAIR